MKLDHNRLDVHQVGLDFAACSYELESCDRVREAESVYGYEYVYEYGEGSPNEPVQSARAAESNAQREAAPCGRRG
jgi:hypothetical protein